jgi:hypothetical protein
LGCIACSKSASKTHHPHRPFPAFPLSFSALQIRHIPAILARFLVQMQNVMSFPSAFISVICGQILSGQFSGSLLSQFARFPSHRHFVAASPRCALCLSFWQMNREVRSLTSNGLRTSIHGLEQIRKEPEATQPRVSIILTAFFARFVHL